MSFTPNQVIYLLKKYKILLKFYLELTNENAELAHLIAQLREALANQYNEFALQFGLSDPTREYIRDIQARYAKLPKTPFFNHLKTVEADLEEYYLFVKERQFTLENMEEKVKNFYYMLVALQYPSYKPHDNMDKQQRPIQTLENQIITAKVANQEALKKIHHHISTIVQQQPHLLTAHNLHLTPTLRATTQQIEHILTLIINLSAHIVKSWELNLKQLQTLRDEAKHNTPEPEPKPELELAPEQQTHHLHIPRPTLSPWHVNFFEHH